VHQERAERRGVYHFDCAQETRHVRRNAENQRCDRGGIEAAAVVVLAVAPIGYVDDERAEWPRIVEPADVFNCDPLNLANPDRDIDSIGQLAQQCLYSR
jgi:hypothetical protein